LHRKCISSQRPHSSFPFLRLFSGLAVQPNLDEGGASDAIFGMAGQAEADEAPPRRTITMYRQGFVVDDGPYRRLDDPENAPFLRALAQGRTPQELMENGGPNITVGLIDKRSQDYEETFRSFSGQGNSLGGGATAEQDSGVVFDPSTLGEAPAIVEGSPLAMIQVRLMGAGRKVVKVPLTWTVRQVAQLVGGSSSFTLNAGFPPAPLQGDATVESAQLKGAQVIQKEA